MQEFFTPTVYGLLAAPAAWRFVTPFQRAPHMRNGAAGMAFGKWASQHRHQHPFHEILLAVGGTAWYQMGESVFRCPPGTMAIIGPNQPHACRYRASDDNLRHIWVSFIAPEQAFLQFVMVHDGKVQRVHDERSLINTGNLGALLRTLRGLADTPAPHQSLQMHLLLTAFFAELIYLIVDTEHQSAGVIDRDALRRKKIGMISEHIRKIGGNATSSDLALLAGYTPGHFAKIFKQITGQTVHQYIDACRLDRAKDMLARHLPLKAMAAELGFADKTTMSRWLNKYRHALT